MVSMATKSYNQLKFLNLVTMATKKKFLLNVALEELTSILSSTLTVQMWYLDKKTPYHLVIFIT